MSKKNKSTIIRILVLALLVLGIIYGGRLERGYFAIGAEILLVPLGIYWICAMRSLYTK